MKAPIQRQMAAIAACGELVEGVRERRVVLGFDRLLESGDPGSTTFSTVSPPSRGVPAAAL